VRDSRRRHHAGREGAAASPLPDRLPVSACARGVHTSSCRGVLGVHTFMSTAAAHSMRLPCCCTPRRFKEITQILQEYQSNPSKITAEKGRH
jgi:hypothetical protein